MLDRLINSYEELNPASPSSWVLISNNPNFNPDVQLGRICHANMRHATKNKWDEAYLAVPKTDKLSMKYIRWLIAGPFQQFKKHIRLHKILDEVLGVCDGKYYIHVTGLDKLPANVLYNFCIASRAPIEFRPTLELWDNLMGLGVPPNLAIILAGFSSIDTPITSLDDHLLCVGPQHVGHWWLDLSLNWNTVLTNTPTEFSSPFKVYPHGCTPTNCIWGFGSSQDTYEKFKLSIRELMEMFHQ